MDRNGRVAVIMLWQQEHHTYYQLWALNNRRNLISQALHGIFHSGFLYREKWVKQNNIDFRVVSVSWFPNLSLNIICLTFLGICLSWYTWLSFKLATNLGHCFSYKRCFRAHGDANTVPLCNTHGSHVFSQGYMAATEVFVQFGGGRWAEMAIALKICSCWLYSCFCVRQGTFFKEIFSYSTALIYICRPLFTIKII